MMGRPATLALLAVLSLSLLPSATASCTSLPCQNNGICNSDDVCECPYVIDADGNETNTPHFYGESCQYENPCVSNPCQNNGICQSLFDENETFVCECVDQFIGELCENVDLCFGVVCQNGGWCEENRGCWCQDGYVGTECEIKDLCYAVTCGEFGECNPDTGTCICENGYYGELCLSDDPCFEVECLNGGSCNQETGTCDCVGGYFGVSCEENDSCVDMNGPIHCENGGYCENSDNDQFVCICTPGFYGKMCELIDYCFEVDCNEGECNFGVCTCNEGFQGEFCDEAINFEDYCDPDPCKFQGVCSNDDTSATGYSCECVEGTTGVDCSIIVAVSKKNPSCVPNPCNSGVCQIDADASLGFSCTCDAGFSGEFCETKLATPSSPTLSEESASSNNTMTGSPSSPSSASSTGTLEMPSQPPKCADYPAQENQEKSLTLKHIKEMSKTLKENIANQGSCWNLIKMRMYGRLAFSKQLLADGPKIQNHIEQFESDELYAKDFAKVWSSTFTDAFAECDDSTCIVETLCENVFHGETFSMSSDDETCSHEIVSQIRHSCMQEAWRFNDFIYSGSLEGVCEFSFVPVAFADAACEKCGILS